MNTWYWYLVLIDVLNRYGIQEVTFQVHRDPLHEHFWQVSLDLMFFCIQVPNLCRYLALEFLLSIWVHPWRVHHSFSYLEGPATNSFPFSKRVVQLTTPLSHNPFLHMSPVRCIWILNWQTWSTHNLCFKTSGFSRSIYSSLGWSKSTTMYEDRGTGVFSAAWH